MLRGIEAESVFSLTCYTLNRCGKDDLQKGNAQKDGRDRQSDAASLARLGFSDFERSLGKKNVFALKTKAADQFGDFLMRLGNSPPPSQVQAMQAGASELELIGSSENAEALSPASVSGEVAGGGSGAENNNGNSGAQKSGSQGVAQPVDQGASLDGDGDLFLEGSRSRLLKGRRPPHVKAGSSSGGRSSGGRGHLKVHSSDGNNSSSSSSTGQVHDGKALKSAPAAADEGRGELVGRAYARHWASGFPAGGSILYII